MAVSLSADLIRDRRWKIQVAILLGAILFGFLPVLVELATLWVSRADYSHGFLVLAFAAYLLYLRRSSFPKYIVRWPDAWGVPFFAVAILLFLVVGRVNIAKEWVQAAALTLSLAGVAVMYCGRWKGLRWALPGLLFLPLAFQLPYQVEQSLSLKLRAIATSGSNFAFQTIGLPSYTEGNVIVIDETRLGVEEACSGLTMLLAFVALALAISFLYTSRHKIDRVMVFLAAVPIAILCNIIRIVVTGLVYHAGWKWLGDVLIHDLAGWLMMPMALGFMWLMLKLIDWVTEPMVRVSTEEALGLRLRGTT